MVPLTSISLNSKPTWSLILESISCCHLMPPSSQLKKPITNNSALLKSPTPLLNPPLWWPNATPDTVNIWLALCFTEVTSSPRMSTLLLPPSRPREPSNSSIGAPPDSRSVLTINPPPSSPEEISLRSWEPSVWFPTLPPSPKSSQDSIINSILCTPREPSSIGTSEKVWKKVNSLKPEKI